MSAPSSLRLPHLYRHCLESILSFCDIAELRCALQLSQEWLAAVHTMRPIAGTMRLRSLSAAVLAPNSPLLRHVGALRGPDSPRDRYPGKLELQISDLGCDGSLALFPALRSLCCFNQETMLPDRDAQATQFPPSLLNLEIGLDLVRWHRLSSRQDWFLTLIARIPQLESLTLHDAAGLTSLQDLVHMSCLRHLTLVRPAFWDMLIHYKDAIIRQLRSMSQLQSLTITDATSDLLEAILAEGHQCKWTSMALTEEPLESAACFAKLPSLTDLRLRIGCRSLEFLAHLPQLTHLELWMASCPADQPAPDFEALRSCTQLTTLVCNRYRPLSAVPLGAVVLQMPKLSTLRIIGARALESLAFLASATVVRSLTSLELRGCTRIPAGDAVLLCGLRSLRSLHLERSFAAPLDAPVLARLQPPSADLPALQSFIFIPLSQRNYQGVK